MPLSMKLDAKVFTTNRTLKLIKLYNKLTNEGKQKQLIKKKKEGKTTWKKGRWKIKLEDMHKNKQKRKIKWEQGRMGKNRQGT